MNNNIPSHLFRDKNVGEVAEYHTSSPKTNFFQADLASSYPPIIILIDDKYFIAVKEGGK